MRFSDPGPRSLTDGVLPACIQGRVPIEKAVPDPGVCFENFPCSYFNLSSCSFVVPLASLTQPVHHSSLHQGIQSPTCFLEHHLIFLIPKHKGTSSILWVDAIGALVSFSLL